MSSKQDKQAVRIYGETQSQSLYLLNATVVHLHFNNGPSLLLAYQHAFKTEQI